MICKLGSIRGNTLTDNKRTTDELIVRFTVVGRSCKDFKTVHKPHKNEYFPSYLSKKEFDNTCRRAEGR